MGAVTEMCTEIFDTEIIPKPRGGRARRSSSVCLSMPSVLSEFCWRGGSLEALARKLIEYAVSVSHPSRGIRVAVREKKVLSDLEQFFALSPRYWLQLSIECQSAQRLESGIRPMFESLGYRCPEWVGVEGSESQLAAFHLGTDAKPTLILHIQNRGAGRNVDLLIPLPQ
jgi:hypothetical protein